MEPSPLIFVGIGAVVAVIAGIFIVATIMANKKVELRARELLVKGVNPVHIFDQLVAEGAATQQAEQIVLKVIENDAVERANGFLDRGLSEIEIVKQLMAKGMDAKTAESAANQAVANQRFRAHPFLFGGLAFVLIVIGVPICFLGLVLRDGNRTGRWVTFPYAGTITSVFGVCLTGTGFGLFYGLWMAQRSIAYEPQEL